MKRNFIIKIEIKSKNKGVYTFKKKFITLGHKKSPTGEVRHSINKPIS